MKHEFEWVAVADLTLIFSQKIACFQSPCFELMKPLNADILLLNSCQNGAYFTTSSLVVGSVIIIGIVAWSSESTWQSRMHIGLFFSQLEHVTLINFFQAHGRSRIQIFIIQHSLFFNESRSCVYTYDVICTKKSDQHKSKNTFLSPQSDSFVS